MGRWIDSQSIEKHARVWEKIGHGGLTKVSFCLKRLRRVGPEAGAGLGVGPEAGTGSARKSTGREVE